MMMMQAAFAGLQNGYLLNQEGTLDAEFLDSISFGIVAAKDLPGMDRFWRQRRGYFHRGYADYVDGLLLRDADETLDIYKRSQNASDK